MIQQLVRSIEKTLFLVNFMTFYHVSQQDELDMLAVSRFYPKLYNFLKIALTAADLIIKIVLVVRNA